MTRITLNLLTIIGLLSVNSPATAQTKPPLNVLFVVADDLRDTIGCYGNKTVQTPNVDRLAARGVRFERAYVQYPVCNPSRSSFLTGLRPDQTGVTDNTTLLRSKRPDVVTLPQLFRQHGYYAAAFGKIFHLGGGRDAAAKERWMDLPKSWDEAHAYQPTLAGRIIEGRNLTGGKLKWCQWGMTAGTDDDQPDGQNAREAIALIEKLADKPWFIGLGFQKPHDPFIAPKKYFDQYPPGSITLYRDPKDMTPAPPLAVGFGDYAAAFGKFTDTERMEFQRAYFAGVSFIDAQLGRVLDALDRLKLTERTLIVFMGDHGYHLGEREWWNKNTLFERSTRTPLIIAAPGGKPGVARGLVEFVDLYPTITDLCDMKPHAGLAGQSLRRLLEEPSLPGKAAAFTMVTRGTQQRGDSIRTDRWRYTEWSDGARELYDHAHDPEETQNIFETNSDTVKSLTEQLHAITHSQSP
jgi:iduronate 2-sulfatase